MKKIIFTLGIVLLTGAGAFAQDSTYLWTCGTGIPGLYNLDEHYNQYDAPWPYSRKNPPAPIIYEKKAWVSVTSSVTNFLAVADDGVLYGWSNGASSTRVPNVIKGQEGTSWKQVVFVGSGWYFLLAQDSTINDKSGDRAVPGDDNWIKLTSTNTLLYALRSDSTVWRWSRNSSGELNNMTQMGVGSKWVDFAATPSVLYGIKDDGTLWRVYPTMKSYMQEGSDSDWKKIFGKNALFALKENGSLWVLGNRNDYGELGIGSTSTADDLTQVGSDTNWDTVFPGEDHSFGLKTDGSIVAWGRNDNYQLGIPDNNTNQTSPVQVGTPGEYLMAIPGDKVSTFFRTWGYDGETSTSSGAPAAPTNLSATPTNSILLNWQDNSDNEDGFYIESATNASGPWDLIETTAPDITTFTHTGLTNGVEYFYRVKAFNSNGESSFSNVASSVETVTGVSETMFANISIYPNPAKNNLTISGIPYLSMIRISDLSGKVKYEGMIVNESESVNLSGFEAGIYLLQIENSGKIANKKLVINR